jgi:hypothetical protein
MNVLRTRQPTVFPVEHPQDFDIEPASAGVIPGLSGDLTMLAWGALPLAVGTVLVL